MSMILTMAAKAVLADKLYKQSRSHKACGINFAKISATLFTNRSSLALLNEL
ncbi:MAG: hypothetical protein FWC76_00770 [Defluviitaleaceae bacterium]|nr:hypothetical protein [Defluviitaleaceae bacterium]